MLAAVVRRLQAVDAAGVVGVFASAAVLAVFAGEVSGVDGVQIRSWAAVLALGVLARASVLSGAAVPAVLDGVTRPTILEQVPVGM